MFPRCRRSSITLVRISVAYPPSPPRAHTSFPYLLLYFVAFPYLLLYFVAFPYLLLYFVAGLRRVVMGTFVHQAAKRSP